MSEVSGFRSLADDAAASTIDAAARQSRRGLWKGGGKALAVLLAAVGSAAVAQGAPLQQTLFGSGVAIVDDAGSEALMVEGRKILGEYRITIEEIAVMDGLGVAAGETHTGGNACDGRPFVLSFPPGGTARLDGPIDSCSSLAREVGSDRITFSAMPLPSRAGDVWIWTPADGIRKGDPVPFKSDPARGWAQLRERDVDHPVRLFGYGEIELALYAAAAGDRQDLLSVVEGPGSAEYKGDLLVATACRAHMCGETGSLIVAHIPERTVFVAWKLAGEKIVVRPEVSKWPADPRSELRI